MKTFSPYNRWFFTSRDKNRNNSVFDISSTTVTSTINENEFFHCRITFDLDDNDVTYTIFGKTTVTASISVPYSIGSIEFFSFGTSHSYFQKQWLDSLSWTWDDDYQLGDLLNTLGGSPPPPGDPNILDYWYYFVIGAVGIGGTITTTTLLTRPNRKRKIPVETESIEVFSCPHCATTLPKIPGIPVVFCPSCRKSIP